MVYARTWIMALGKVDMRGIGCQSRVSETSWYTGYVEVSWGRGPSR